MGLKTNFEEKFKTILIKSQILDLKIWLVPYIINF